MLSEILQTDTNLFLFLNGLGNPLFDSFWLLMTNAKTWILLYIIFVYCIYSKEKNIWKSLLVILLVGALVGVNDGLSNIAKHYFERPRPCRNEEILNSPLFRMVANHCSKYGYFSAHASNHFAMATFLGIYFKSSWKYSFVLLLFWASIVAYSRIYVGVHYPLDILTGTIVGCFFGLIFIKYLYPVCGKQLDKII